MTQEEIQEVRAKFKAHLNRNKKLVDNYLEIEYNSLIRQLVRADDDKVRGKLQFIESLKAMLGD